MAADGMATELSRVDLFRDLSPDAMAHLSGEASVVTLDPGDVLFSEGEPGDAVFVVRKGMLRIFRAADPSVTLSTMMPGDALGELAVLNASPRTASAAAIDETQLLRVSKDSVDRVLQDAQNAREMLGRLAESLTLAREQVVKENLLLDQAVRDRTEQLRLTQLEVIRRLARAAEFRDDDTGLHIARMSQLSVALAKEAGVGEAECELLLHAVPMHDIGKIGIPDAILLKKGKLTPQEFEVMKSHTTIGAELLEGATSNVMELAGVIAMNHHEKWNGAGYPNGTSGADIPFFARVASIADVFDALTSKRPYKDPWPEEKAFALISEEAGTSFDPHLAPLFVSMGERVVRILKEFADSRAAEVTHV